jgi:hypothetical protein
VSEVCRDHLPRLRHRVPGPPPHAELPTGDNGQAKRSTAIGYLVEMADVASERLRLRAPTSAGSSKRRGRPASCSAWPTISTPARSCSSSGCPPTNCRGWCSIPPASGSAPALARQAADPLVLPAAYLAGVEPRAPAPRALLVGSRRPRRRGHRSSTVAAPRPADRHRAVDRAAHLAGAARPQANAAPTFEALVAEHVREKPRKKTA